MLTLKPASVTGDIAVIEVDVVRLNNQRRAVLKEVCNSEEGIAMGAFMVHYELSTVIQLHRGSNINHEAFTDYLNSMM